MLRRSLRTRSSLLLSPFTCKASSAFKGGCMGCQRFTESLQLVGCQCCCQRLISYLRSLRRFRAWISLSA
eukprot:759574-Hanusia_phi.AAC.14